ncbi:MAG TPA: hypothetical protein PLM53_18940 [Spirochaetota bacterium]|nr:hypothetical protein [Spirochaetota bacterium]HPC42816.1 hypothetical protein [Spirochaetota bacterium]HPL18005.1 hypothetical protein [Spirochaetota bacterium]HQF10295.1 hypothetical protein [Spirochaetota bacterium]HQH99173.1 hypothetical protein [Spirochaetota bacterium]
MKIAVFSNTKNIEKSFAGAVKGKKHTLQVSPASELKKSSKSVPRGSLIYADLSSFKKTEVPQVIKLLAKLEGIPFGIMDPKGAVADVADLFHNGASDYLDAALLKKGVDQKRIDRILDFKNIEVVDEKLTAAKKNYILSGPDWKNIKQGQEYTFYFLFIELDNKNALKGLAPELQSDITETFRRYVEETIAPMNGRIWMWMNFGGLVLFPYNGKQCDVIEAALRLMVNRKLMSAESIQLDINLSYRIAMHVGNTVYKSKGDTGSIVSDSINSVFHLGQKYTEPNNFFLTDDIFMLIPSRLMNYYVPAGEYEGRNIFRLKHIL